jgi:DNA-binding transcriptional LysR family regulator
MENINFEMYKVFSCVAKNRNVTKASQELMISQPAITQTIKKLEDQIEYKLFFRTKKGMELTEDGEILYENIKNSVECLNKCKSNLESNKEETSKTIRIGGGTTLLKHNALSGFKKFKVKYPNIKIEIIRDVTSELLNKLENNTIDLFFFNMPFGLKDNIIDFPIENVQDAFIASNDDFKYLRNKTLDFKEIGDLPLVLQADVSSSRKYLNSICKKNKVFFNNTYELASYDLVLTFVKAGLGVGFINKNHVKEELASGSLFEVKTNYNIPPRKIGVAINKKNARNKYLNEFINMIKE